MSAQFNRRVKMVIIKDNSLSTGHLFKMFQKPYGEYGGLPADCESRTTEEYFGCLSKTDKVVIKQESSLTAHHSPLIKRRWESPDEEGRSVSRSPRVSVCWWLSSPAKV